MAERGIKTHLVVFYDKASDPALEAEILEPATKWRGQVPDFPSRPSTWQDETQFLFIHIPPTEEQIMDYFGVPKAELPAVRIVDLSTDQMKKFAFQGSEIKGGCCMHTEKSMHYSLDSAIFVLPSLGANRR